MSCYSALKAFRVTFRGQEVLEDIEKSAGEWRWFKTKEGDLYVQVRDYQAMKRLYCENVQEISKKELALARTRAICGGSGAGGGGVDVQWVKDPALVKEERVTTLEPP